jgi:hypothetical protein
MSVPQFIEFVKMVPQIASWLEAAVQGLTVPRPDYSDDKVKLAKKYDGDPRRAAKAKELKPFREKTKGHKRLDYYGKDKMEPKVNDGKDETQPTLPFVKYGIYSPEAYEAKAQEIEQIDEARIWGKISALEMEKALKKNADKPFEVDGPINLKNIAAQYYDGDIITDKYHTHGHELYTDLDEVLRQQSTESKDSDVDMNDADSEGDSLAKE